jgi:hypothetical protein
MSSPDDRRDGCHRMAGAFVTAIVFPTPTDCTLGGAQMTTSDRGFIARRPCDLPRTHCGPIGNESRLPG